MRTLWLIPVLALLLGCAPQIVPVKVAGGVVDLKAGSQSLERSGVTVSARLDQLQYAPYRQVDNITSFHLDVINGLNQDWSFPFEKLLLVSRDGRQFTAVSPLQVKEMVSRDLPYMVPYPYVGYYYLEDAQKGSYFNSFTSDLPYYAANRPQDIFTQALPEGPIKPGNRVSGLVYFVADLTTMPAFTLTLAAPAKGAYPGGDFVFPFSVEK